MNNFCNNEYLMERLSAVCKERDELKREVENLKQIVEKQARMNRTSAKMALDLDTVTGERDRLNVAYEAMAKDLQTLTDLLSETRNDKNKLFNAVSRLCSMDGADPCEFCKWLKDGKCTHEHKQYCCDDECFWEWKND